MTDIHETACVLVHAAATAADYPPAIGDELRALVQEVPPEVGTRWLRLIRAIDDYVTHDVVVMEDRTWFEVLRRTAGLAPAIEALRAEVAGCPPRPLPWLRDA